MQPDKTLSERGREMPRWKQLLTESSLLDQVYTTFPSPSSAGTDKAASRMAVIQGALLCLTEAGQVVELRVLGVNGKKRTDSGYFSDLGKLAQAAMSYDGRAEGIYFTINPVNPDLLARADNRVKAYADHTTSDQDVLKRITLPIDFDPVRPAGISANPIEKQASLERAWACRVWLTAQGWPEPVFADSGNGAHLLYALDLPNTTESSELVKRCLLALSSLFSDDQVKVDTSTGNASRIFKLYGTLARKGDNTTERPHRRAAIITAPAQRLSVSQTQLEALATHAPFPSIPAASSIRQPSFAKSGHNNYGKASLDKELAILAAAPSGNRNNQLFRSAAALFSLVASRALDQSEVWQALLNTAQTIGLSDHEAQRTLQSAAKRGLSQPRSIPKPSVNSSPQPDLDIRQAAPASDFSTVPTQKLPASAARSLPNTKTSTAANLLMHVDELDELPPIRWLIKEYLPEDCLVEVYGAPSAGKTQVVFDMAQTLAAAGQTVIYVVAEGLRGYRARKKAWQQFRKQQGGNLFIWREPVQLFEASAVRAFIETINPKQPVLVVFDTLSRCSLGADENNQKDMGFILESLDKVRRETGATVIAVHHTNAAGGRERGSTVIRGGMSVMLEVSKDDDLIAVSCAKVKDSGEFNTLFLKPVLVDIGEDQSVPVLIPAEKRLQTPADRLSTLQLDILRAVGMEMFNVSGIKSSQLDELLPPTTKRASKYYSLNNLIRLGYVAPHDKGDPYLITEAGRLKLSNAENAMAASMSSMSKASSSPFIWTLPEACTMSSPIPHTCGCGMDETLDNQPATQTTTDTERSVNVADETSVPLPNVQDIAVGPPVTLGLTEEGSCDGSTKPPSPALDPSTLIVSHDADRRAACSGDLAGSQYESESVDSGDMVRGGDRGVFPTFPPIAGSESETAVKGERGVNSGPTTNLTESDHPSGLLFNVDALPPKYSGAWRHHPDFMP
ncbi:MAG: AAA family ATPase [Aggregatilineales bacterium]